MSTCRFANIIWKVLYLTDTFSASLLNNMKAHFKSSRLQGFLMHHPLYPQWHGWKLACFPMCMSAVLKCFWCVNLGWEFGLRVCVGHWESVGGGGCLCGARCQRTISLHYHLQTPPGQKISPLSFQCVEPFSVHITSLNKSPDNHLNNITFSWLNNYSHRYNSTGESTLPLFVIVLD